MLYNVKFETTIRHMMLVFLLCLGFSSLAFSCVVFPCLALHCFDLSGGCCLDLLRLVLYCMFVFHVVATFHVIPFLAYIAQWGFVLLHSDLCVYCNLLH